MFTALFHFAAVPVAYADAASDEVYRIAFLLRDIVVIVDYLIIISIGLAFLYFFWGLAVFIRKESESGDLEKGKNRMIWGVLAIFVMTSVWGIVYFLELVLLGGRIGYTGIESFRLPEGVGSFGPVTPPGGPPVVTPPGGPPVVTPPGGPPVVGPPAGPPVAAPPGAPGNGS